jgi:outer membrane cobalamin receptor
MRFSDGVENDTFTNRGIGIKSGFKNKHIKTALLFFGHFSDSGIPFYLGNPSPRRQYKQNHYIFILPFSFHFKGSTNIKIRISHNRNQYEFEDPDDTWTPFYLNKSVVNEGQVSLHTILFKTLSLNSGLEYSDQKILNEDHTGIQLDDEKTHYLSAFFTAGLDLKKIQLSSSLRYDHYKGMSSEYSPQLGFAYRVSKQFKIRGSYSESFRAPTLPERLNPQWGNPDLEPETGKSFEIGGEFYLKSATFSLVYFNSRYENLIGYSPITWAFANINEANISGIELSTRFTLFNQVVVWTSYTYLDTHDFQNNQELIRRPKHSFSAMISYKNKYFTISSEMIYVGKRLDYDELLWTTAESPSFDTYNFSLNIPLNEKLSVVGKATNAFNREYQEVQGYPAPGRRFLLGIKYKIR